MPSSSCVAGEDRIRPWASRRSGKAVAPDRAAPRRRHDGRVVAIPLQLLPIAGNQAARSRRWAPTSRITGRASAGSLPSRRGGNTLGLVASLAGFSPFRRARLRITPHRASRLPGLAGRAVLVTRFEGGVQRRRLQVAIDRASATKRGFAPATRSQLLLEPAQFLGQYGVHNPACAARACNS